jgi:hypothetical protein
MATASERARAARARDAAAGICQINLRIPEAHGYELARIAQWLCSERPRELTGIVIRNRRGQVLTMALDQMPPGD